MREMQELIDKLRGEFPGYHIQVSIYPAGGMLDLEGCEECGTSGYECASWRYQRGVCNTIDHAVAKLKSKLPLPPVPEEKG